MNYFKIDAAGAVVAIADEFPAECNKGGDVWARKPIGGKWDEKYSNSYIGAGWLNRNDMDAELAAKIAESASAMSGKVWLVSDQGECCSPRYDVLEARRSATR